MLKLIQDAQAERAPIQLKLSSSTRLTIQYTGMVVDMRFLALYDDEHVGGPAQVKFTVLFS